MVILPSTESYVVGARFFSSLMSKAARLEQDAERDEVFAATLKDLDHRRRHLKLAQLQRDQASLLRNFLAVATIRPAA